MVVNVTSGSESDLRRSQGLSAKARAADAKKRDSLMGNVEVFMMLLRGLRLAGRARPMLGRRVANPPQVNNLPHKAAEPEGR
jgi:hypothetical protein